MKNRILCAALAVVLSLLPVMQVNATTISDAKKQKEEAENKLNSVNENIEEALKLLQSTATFRYEFSKRETRKDGSLEKSKIYITKN